MAVDDFNPADLAEVAAALVAIEGVRTADTDPAAIRTPGVWIRFDGLGSGTLAGLSVKATLHAVVGSTGDHGRDLAAVAAFYNLIKPVVDQFRSAGDVTPIALVLPGSTSGLPCLQLPIELLTTN